MTAAPMSALATPGASLTAIQPVPGSVGPSTRHADAADFARIIARVNKNGPLPPEPSRRLDTPCWIWTGGLFPAGYGSVSIGNQTQLVHRVVYIALVGPIADGLDLDHVCRVRRCCRPDHLEQVTRLENILRTRRPFCCNGHEFTEENTGPGRNENQRVCRACSREKTRRHRERRAQHAA